MKNVPVPRIFRTSLALALLPLLLLALDEYSREASKLASLMNWKPGEVIAEIGAGEGQMSFFAASRVGASGHVYTTELDREKLAHLKEEVNHRKLPNVTVVQAGPVATNLGANCCDAIFMRRVYHHFKEPAKTDAEIFNDLKPGGLLAVIDFTPKPGLPPVEGAPKNHGGHGIPKQVLEQELTSAGFEIVNEPRDWPGSGDYCVIARKPPAAQ